MIRGQSCLGIISSDLRTKDDRCMDGAVIDTVLGPCRPMSYKTYSILNGIDLTISNPYQILYETLNECHVNVPEFVDTYPYTKTTTLENVTIFEHSTYW